MSQCMEGMGGDVRGHYGGVWEVVKVFISHCICLLVFDLNRWPIPWTNGHRSRSNMYIHVYHTNRGPIKNTISVVKKIA